MRRIRLRDEKGQSFVEFAIGLPVLMLIIAALIQAGVYFHREITLNDAVRAAGREAMLCRVSPTSNPQAAGNSAANGLSISWSVSSCPSAGGNRTVSGTASVGNLGFPILGSIFPSTVTKSVTVVAE